MTILIKKVKRNSNVLIQFPLKAMIMIFYLQIWKRVRLVPPLNVGATALRRTSKKRGLVRRSAAGAVRGFEGDQSLIPPTYNTNTTTTFSNIYNFSKIIYQLHLDIFTHRTVNKTMSKYFNLTYLYMEVLFLPIRYGKYYHGEMFSCKYIPKNISYIFAFSKINTTILSETEIFLLCIFARPT